VALVNDNSSALEVSPATGSGKPVKGPPSLVRNGEYENKLLVLLERDRVRKPFYHGLADYQRV
jgi:hypothetical protein